MSDSREGAVTDAQARALDAIAEVAARVDASAAKLADPAQQAQPTFFDRMDVWIGSRLALLGGLGALCLNYFQERPVVPLPVAAGVTIIGLAGYMISDATPRAEERLQRLRNTDIREKLNHAARAVRDGATHPQVAEKWASDIRVERSTHENSNDGPLEQVYYRRDVSIPPVPTRHIRRRA